MRSRPSVERWDGLAAVGAFLVVAGAAWFVLREFRLDPFAAIADAGWPYLVIAPGVALLALSMIPSPPRGVGFAIAGAIVTAAGTVLLYQVATADWESWAYAWALVGPGAAGLGMGLYGLIFRERDLVAAGARLVAIAAAIFIAGYWFFETVFATGRAPIDLGPWWPGVIVAVGLVVLFAGWRSRGHESNPRARAKAGGGTR